MKRYKFIILLMSTLLCSCVAVVVAGAAAGMVVYDKRSVVMMESDARIFYQINTRVASDPKFRNSHIVISSFNQVVLLAGQTPVESTRAFAEQIARSTPNVVRVYNQITIQDPTSLTQRSKDAWITSQVRAQMLTKRGLESGSIHIVTENSVVYLMGIATREQSNLSVDVARHVRGVSKVVKVFRYIV
jgi:osmotically-inducible protein OsmY